MTETKKIIGITGGIGSGKTAVAEMLSQMNFPVYNSDIRAKEIVNENPLLKEKIIELLGNQAYQNQTYNTPYVAQKVFGNSELLKQLNAIIHPAVGEDFKIWIKKQKSDWVFKETAILFEAGLDKNCDCTLLITAEKNIRIQRVVSRDKRKIQEIEKIIGRQMPEEEKIKKADFVIENNYSKEELFLQVKEKLTLIKDFLAQKKD